MNDKNTVTHYSEDEKSKTYPKLPEEIWRVIFTYMTPVSLCRCAQVSKSWNSLVQSLDVTTWWSHYLHSSEWKHPHWPIQSESVDVSWQQSYKENYILSRRWLLGGRDESHTQCLLVRFHRRRDRKTIHVGENCDHKTIKSALSTASDYDRILIYPGIYDEQFEMSSKIAYELIGHGELGSVVLMMCVEQNSVTGRICNLTFRAPWFTANVLTVKSGHIQVDNCVFEDGHVQVSCPGTCHMRYTSFVRSSLTLYHVKLSVVEHCQFEASETAAIHVEGFPKDEENWAHKVMLKSSIRKNRSAKSLTDQQPIKQPDSSECCIDEEDNNDDEGAATSRSVVESCHPSNKCNDNVESLTLKMLQDGGYIIGYDSMLGGRFKRDSSHISSGKEMSEELFHSDSSSYISTDEQDTLCDRSKPIQRSPKMVVSDELAAAYNQPVSLFTDLQNDRTLHNALKRTVGCIFRNCKIIRCRGGIIVCSQGQVKVIGCELSDLHYGVRCISNAKAVVMDCRIHHCLTSGVFMRLAATGVIAGNDIYCTGEAGIDIRKDADPIIQCNRIHHGKRSGIAVLGCGQGSIVSNDIYQNKEAGIYILLHGDPVIRKNKICQGHAAGISISDNGRGQISDNLISANHWGGVDIRHGADPVIRHNLICNGLADGAVIGEGGRGFLDDNIICGNSGCGIWVMSGDRPLINANKIYSNTDSGIAFVTAEDGVYGPNSGQDGTDNSSQGTGDDQSDAQYSEDLAVLLDNGIQRSTHNHQVALVQFNTVYHNGGSGVYLNGCEPISIYANVVHANGDTGISAELTAAESNALVAVHDNSITCNTGCGIQVAPHSEVDIQGNGIYDNCGHGLHIQTGGRVVQNDIIGNQMCGLVLDRCSAVKVEENRVHSPNEVAVCVQGCTKVSFSGNTLYKGSWEVMNIHKEAESTFLKDSIVIQLHNLNKSENVCSEYAAVKLENPSARPHISAPQPLPTRGPSRRVMSVTTVTAPEAVKCQTGSKFCNLL